MSETKVGKQSLVNLLGVFVEAKRTELEEYDLRPDALETQFSKFWHGQIDEAELLIKSEGAQEAMSADQFSVEDGLRLIRKMRHCDGESAKLLLLRHFGERYAADLRAENTHLRAAIPKWISTKERIPEGWAIVIIDGHVQRQAARLEYGAWIWADEDADSAPKEVVTHWQPLPEPPKEQK